jgi:hypothetical protein
MEGAGVVVGGCVHLGVPLRPGGLVACAQVGPLDVVTHGWWEGVCTWECHCGQAASWHVRRLARSTL